MFRNKITAKFGMGRVEGGDVERLRELFYQQIDEVLKDVQTRLDVKMKEIEDAIGKISFEFIDDVLKDMKARTEKLQASIRNREENMRKYEQVISALEEDCRQLIHA
jgi:predicted  nucleic acid-binding Zn-ribbon protein